MWRSEKTKLSTDWHGKWASTAEGFRCEFDCKYDGSAKCKRKWANIVPGGAGKDYRGHTIHVSPVASWPFLDHNTMDFVCDRHEVRMGG